MISLSGFNLRLPRVSQTKEQIIDVLLSIMPVLPKQPLDLHGLIES